MRVGDGVISCFTSPDNQSIALLNSGLTVVGFYNLHCLNVLWSRGDTVTFLSC